MKIDPTEKQGTDFPKLAAPARRALSGAGFTRLEQLTQASESAIKDLHGIGPNALEQLRHALAARGLSFAEQKREKKMKTTDTQDVMTGSQHITRQISGLADWRGEMMGKLRTLILEAAPDITEEWKWDTAVWSHKGNVVAASAFKDHVKLNFFKGAFLKDPRGLFNAGLEAKATRSIDFSEGDKIQASALQELVRAAVAYNLSGGR